MNKITKEAIAHSSVVLMAGAAAAATKHATTYTHGKSGQMAANVGSAIGAAAANGAGVGGSIAAGAAIVTAKAAAVAATAAAAAPFVVGAAAIGAISYGLFKLFED